MIRKSLFILFLVLGVSTAFIAYSPVVQAQDINTNIQMIGNGSQDNIILIAQVNSTKPGIDYQSYSAAGNTQSFFQDYTTATLQFWKKGNSPSKNRDPLLMFVFGTLLFGVTVAIRRTFYN